jgi:hypothetical protein
MFVGELEDDYLLREGYGRKVGIEERAAAI